jgi:hypothetical protein
MEKSRREIRQEEKPGRLQLAIVEWQRQLVAKREARAEALIRDGERASSGIAA